MSDHMERQMDRIMDNNEEVESRCVTGCGYLGPWQMRGKEIEELRAEVERLEDILHEYFLARAGYMHHATKRLVDECNRINQKREAGGADHE